MPVQELRLGGGVELDLPSLARYSGEGSCRLVTAVWPGTDKDKVSTPVDHVYRYLDMSRYILSRYLYRRLCTLASLLAGVVAWAGLCGKRTAARAV